MAAPSAAAAAAPPDAAAVQARRDELFKKMLADPSDLDVSFEYALLSARAGDLEAAVSTLERMLIFSPGLPRIQLELGALYYRLGAFETARGYFVEATAGVGVPPEVKARVAVFLSAIDTATATTRLSAQVFTGVRWDSNVNSGPSSSSVDLNGITFTLDDTATANADYSFVASGNVHFALDLGTQSRDRIEADLLIYNKSHYEETNVDIQVGELTLGPSFGLKRFGLDNTVIGTYGIANAVRLGNDPYFYTGGVGVRVVSKPTTNSILHLKSEARRQWYVDTDARPTSTDRDGDEFRNSMSFSVQAARWLRFTAGGLFNQRDVDAAWLDRLEYGAYGGVAVALGSELPWILSLAGGYTWRDYRVPDVTIDVDDSQRDRERWARLALTMPLTAWLAITAQAEYREVKSNYDTATYDNTAGMVGLSTRF